MEYSEHDPQIRGVYEPPVRELLAKIEPLFEGIPRYICALAINRALAGLLGPAKPETREAFIASLHGIWREMDKLEVRDGSK